VLVAHTCNPSYSGGSEQEDRDSKPVEQIVHKTLSQKTQHKTLGETQVLQCLSSKCEDLSSKPQYCQKKKPDIEPSTK
jgi:hypothetical protein